MALPAFVPSPLGPVTVLLVDEISGSDDLGEFKHDTRTIKIKRDSPEVVQWYTLYHEVMHLVLNDCGPGLRLGKKTEEALCDAYASFMVATKRLPVRGAVAE